MTYSFVYLDSNNKLTNLNAFDFNLNTITVNNNSVLNGPLQVNNNVNISKNLNINGNLNVKEGFILPNKKNNNTIGSIYYDNTNHKFYGYYGDTNSWKNLGGIDNTLDTTISKNLNVLQNINVLGNINIDGDIIPDIHNKYSLGAPDNAFKDVFVGPGSLYINKKQVIHDTSGTITVTTSNDQNLSLKTSGTGNLQLTSEKNLQLTTSGTGDIELTSGNKLQLMTSSSGNIDLSPGGSGIIQVKKTLQITDGQKITSSGGQEIVFANNIHLEKDILLTGKFKVGSSSTSTAGTNGQILSSTGTGLSWIDNYTLPTANETTLGGVKVGTGLGIDNDGKLSVTGGSSLWTTAQNGSDIHRSSGNVGIGTTSPSEKLHVDGNIKLTGSIEGPHFGFKKVGDWIYMYDPINGAATYGDSYQNWHYNKSVLNFNIPVTTGTRKFGWSVKSGSSYKDIMTLNVSDERLGIGTASPSQTLDVTGIAKATRFICCPETNYGLNITLNNLGGSYNYGGIAWYTTESNAVAATGSGRHAYIELQKNNYKMDIQADGGIGVYGNTIGLKVHTGAFQGYSDVWISINRGSSGPASHPKIETNYGGLYFSIQGNYSAKIAAGNNGTTMNFTGQHRCVPHNMDLYNNVEQYIGYIVYSTGYYKTYDHENKKLLSNKNSITINDSLPIVDLTNKKKQKTVFGIISNKEEDEREYSAGNFITPYSNEGDDKRLYINSVGEGAIWIVNTNGNLENGDYIQSSNIVGLGEKQDDDLLHNFTVAKITCDCTFDLNSTNYNCIEIIDPISGNTYIKAFVGCTYHCG